MKKDKEFNDTRFSADVLREALRVQKEVAARLKIELNNSRFKVDHDDASWQYDNIDEFLADFRRYQRYAYLTVWGGELDLSVTFGHRNVTVSVKAPNRADVEMIFEVFEKHAKDAALPAPPQPKRPPPTVFVGHGRSQAWRDLKDHLHDKHGIAIEAYESGARAGHTIRDILEQMIEKSSFALLVMTGEDAQEDGEVRARQNVIHEAGLFQGRLGFSRAILLLEEGVELFSNVQGVQYISFSKGNIKETFGEVLATLRREFP
jgi:predicted nucleotide-binding protein